MSQDRLQLGSGKRPLGGALDAYSYEAQLVFLQTQVALCRSLPQMADTIRMLLSLTESIKEAREHNLNCRRAP